VPPPPAPVAAAAPAAPAAQQIAASKVTFAADTLFDFDKYVLKPKGRATLDDLVSKIKDVNLEVIIAVGHTDWIGTVAYNQKLSVRRAGAVKAYLVSKGIEKNRIYTEGKGKSQPIADNRTAAGRAQNRRVEIEVVGTRAVK
jgi:OOP family OmpA-OmpF porin